MRGEDPGDAPLPDQTEQIHHILTHDLKNKLTIIIGYTDVLLGDVEDPETLDRLETIKRQTIAAEALVSTAGAQTRSSTQGGGEPVDVAEVLSKEVDRLRSAYPEADISVAVDGPVRAEGGELLYSVFGNLLENSLQHNESPTPQIHVTAAVEDDTAIITFEDNGPGLPDTVHDQLEGRDLAHPTSGTHIVRSLVDRYDGYIAVDTRESGTTITIRLQKAPE